MLLIDRNRVSGQTQTSNWTDHKTTFLQGWKGIRTPPGASLKGAQGMVCCIIEEGFGPWTMQDFDTHRIISVPKTVSDPEHEEVVGG